MFKLHGGTPNSQPQPQGQLLHPLVCEQKRISCIFTPL